jgi:hypothetical protein
MTTDIERALARAGDTVPVRPLDLTAIRYLAGRRKAAQRVGWTGAALGVAGTAAIVAVAFARPDAALSVAERGRPIEGVATYPRTSRTHVLGPVEYPQDPPAGGPHAPQPQACGVYTAPIANTSAVHSLEHGALWITYGPQVPAEDVAALTRLVRDHPYRLLSPYPSLGARISLQAWGSQLFVDSADDPRVDEFADRYTEGPDTPEPGSGCTGTQATVRQPHDVLPTRTP